MRSPESGAVLLRMSTGVTLIAVTFALIWVPVLDLGFVLLVAVFASVGLYEYYALALMRGVEPKVVGGLVCGLFIVLSGLFGSASLTSLVLFAAIGMLTWLHVSGRNHSLSALAVSVFGLIYVGWLPAHLVLLHEMPGVGAGLVTLVIVAVALSDTGAYFTGKSIGKRKLAPRVSPNKTVEGAIGGVLCALVGMLVLHQISTKSGWTVFPAWPLSRYLFTGLVLSVAGQIGDLAESMLKRDAGVKDSGKFLPGHGGALDRCDGFLFTAPMLFYMASF